MERSWDREHKIAKAFVLPVLLFTFSGLATPQVVPPVNGRDQDDLRFSVEVDLVVLQVTVRDRAGHAVSGLAEHDLRFTRTALFNPSVCFGTKIRPSQSAWSLTTVEVCGRNSAR